MDEFKDLLDDPKTPELKEREHILPFFARHEHLVALMGTYNPRIENFDRIAFEFDIFGDHTADVAVGDSKTHQYCFVEFEDATATSIFKKTGRKTTLEWSDRFNHGCSQVIDWILWLENMKRTDPYLGRFGVPEIQYAGLVVVGRDKYVDAPLLQQRLLWRSEHVVVCSRKLHCITFDQLYADLDTRLKIWNRR
ncbi:Shedu anti-phage system protein SduA domain-containing protein [Singulisphaera rosea]